MNVSVSHVALALAAIFVVRRLLVRRGHGPLPPGPRGLPVIGNVLDIPNERQWLTYSEWGRRWGDLVYVNIMGSPLLVINSLRAAKDMLEKKASIYSDRPVLPMGGQLVGWEESLGLTQYGDQSNRYRKLFHQVMGTRATVEQWHPLVNMETVRMLQRILKEPEHTFGHIRTAIGAQILMLTYGYEVKDKDDELIKVVSQAMEDFGRVAVPGNFLVDFIPALMYVPEWFPGASWKRIAKRMARDFRKFADTGYAMTREKMAKGPVTPSFTSVYLSSDEALTRQREHDIKYTAVGLYGGGSDTTVAGICSFVLAMTLFPDIQKKAQAEINAVVGSSRLPVFNDRDRLPYVDAILKEVLRWQPISPISIPHAVRTNDFHNGYFIPKGTGIIVNLWQMLHDPESYKEPMEFRPERFLPTDGSEPESDPHIAAFGVGRRICPGILLADVSLFTAIAMILATFDISKAVENGAVVEPEVEYCSGISLLTLSNFVRAMSKVKLNESGAISLIDFAPFLDGTKKEEVADAMLESFKSIGFVYLVNHGLPQEKINDMFSWSRQFFGSPMETKKLAPHPPSGAHHRGYSAPGMEKVVHQVFDKDDLAANRAKAPDVKESFEVGREDSEDMPNIWLPEGVLPGFKEACLDFYWTMDELKFTVLRALALGLRLDEEFFVQYHQAHDNQLRLLHYPSVPVESLQRDEIVRIGAHSDFGSITLLFQDEVGGLEVEDPNEPGVFRNAVKIALRSWELGALAEAELEFFSPSISVFGNKSIPPPSHPAFGGALDVFRIAEMTIQDKPADSPTLVRDGAAGDPASIGVAVLLYHYACASREDDHRSDNVFMVPPFLAYFGALDDHYAGEDLMQEAYNQCRAYRAGLFDEDASLWRHIALGSYEDRNHWSTGNAWAAAGMMRVLQTIRHFHVNNKMKSEQDDLRIWIKEILDGAWKHQDLDGALHNYIDQHDTFPETSGTALMAATTYRYIVLTGDHTHAGRAKKAFDYIHVNLDWEGWLHNTVDPVKWSALSNAGEYSPEGQSFVLMLQRAYEDYAAMH
ncbi:hypothetical protein EWM64_g140 [Hericium alpestre]|uniref:Fe2OG dioxygenase domain-containing protein n=1 Tax=Hericium alpestre TaxID=135208 RepID=A0A4Z0AC26_9AGAM|nr:hypothetical protein EWM64_g140 [Hericium alpestre]